MNWWPYMNNSEIYMWSYVESSFTFFYFVDAENQTRLMIMLLRLIMVCRMCSCEWLQVFMCNACLIIVKVRSGCQVPWNWSSRGWWAHIWMLEAKRGTSAKETSALNIWAITSAPHIFIISSRVTDT